MIRVEPVYGTDIVVGPGASTPGGAWYKIQQAVNAVIELQGVVFMTEGEKIKAISKVLKKYFTNLTVDQTIEIAVDISRAVSDSSS